MGILDGMLFLTGSRRVVTTDVEGVISGYVALWGSSEQRDSYETWFDHEHPPEMNLDMLPISLYYEHGMDEFIGKDRIGVVESISVDEHGIKFEARLNRNHPQFRRFIREIDNEEHGVSSGTLDYLGSFDDDGRFVNWPVGDISLTKNPAEERMMQVPVTLLRSSKEANGEGERDAHAVADDDKADFEPNLSKRQENEMNINEMIQQLLAEGATVEMIIEALLGAGATAEMLQAAIDAMRQDAPAEEAPEALAAPDMATVTAALSAVLNERKAENEAATAARSQTEQMAAMKAQIATLTNQLQTEPPQQQNRTGGTPPDHTGFEAGDNRFLNITHMGDYRFDHLDAAEMELGWQIKQAARNARRDISPLSDAYVRAMCDKVQRVVKDDTGGKFSSKLRSVMRTADTRADEVINTGNTGYGAEWVGETWETALWEKVRQVPIWEEMVSRGMMQQEIPRGSNTIHVPLESTGFTWYVTPESADTSSNDTTPVPTASKMGTGVRDITTKKLSALSYVSGEEDEDSIIDILPEIRRIYEIEAQEQIEYVILNGDTATGATTNINDIAGTPAGTENFLLMNGMLKLGLVTNTDNSKDANATISEDLFNQVQLLLGVDGVYAINPEKVMWVMDNLTRNSLGRVAPLKTADVATESRATLIEGVPVSIWGIDLFTSGQMAKANSAGKVDLDTVANNAYGRAVLVRPDRWKLAWKRQIEFDFEKDIKSDTYTSVMRFRLGIGYYDTDASAVLYNIAV